MNKTQFQVCGDEPDGVQRGTLTGVDINMRDFLALTETLLEQGWPIPADTLVHNYKSAIDELFGALARHAPEAADQLKAEWAKGLPGEQVTIDPKPGQIFQSPSPHTVAEWELGGHPAHEWWAKDHTATDYEQYVKGWDACVRALVSEVSRVEAIGNAPSGQTNDETREWYNDHPLAAPPVGSDIERLVREWLESKVND